MVRLMTFQFGLSDNGHTGWMLSRFWTSPSGPYPKFVLFWNGTLIIAAMGFCAAFARSCWAVAGSGAAARASGSANARPRSRGSSVAVLIVYLRCERTRGASNVRPRAREVYCTLGTTAPNAAGTGDGAPPRGARPRAPRSNGSGSGPGVIAGQGARIPTIRRHHETRQAAAWGSALGRARAAHERRVAGGAVATGHGRADHLAPPRRRPLTASRRASLVGMTVLALVSCGRPLAAQASACSEGRPELRALEFTGNHALPDRTLAAAVEASPSSWLHRATRRFGERRCLAPGALTRDVVRLMLLYRRRGYPGVRVDTAVRQPRPDARVVRFVIVEGPPVRVDSVSVVGVTDSALRRRLAEQVTLRRDDVLDLAELEASRVAVEHQLRREGNLAARVEARTLVDSAARRGAGVITVQPGPRVRLGEVHVDALGRRGETPRVADAKVR